MNNIKSKIFSLSTLLFIGCGDTTSSDTSSNSDSTDITNAIFTKQLTSCSDYVNTYTSDITELKNDTSLSGSLIISDETSTCSFATNSIPNHDVNSTDFVDNVAVNTKTYYVTKTPTDASSVTDISMRTDNAVFLNGVKLDLLSAGCYGIGDGKIGCNDIDQPFRFDPMYSGNDFGADKHNAHTQPNSGEYHYHGSPNAMFNTSEAIQSPVIGFAADGYPIFGSYFNDNGTIRKAVSGYVLKTGTRASILFKGTTYNTSETYLENYNGRFVDDWEHNTSKGDLDECNGMTVDGKYGYYVTDTYPWVVNCFKGTVNSSFEK